MFTCHDMVCTLWLALHGLEVWEGFASIFIVSQLLLVKLQQFKEMPWCKHECKKWKIYSYFQVLNWGCYIMLSKMVQIDNINLLFLFWLSSSRFSYYPIVWRGAIFQVNDDSFLLGVAICSFSCVRICIWQPSTGMRRINWRILWWCMKGIHYLLNIA